MIAVKKAKTIYYLFNVISCVASFLVRGNWRVVAEGSEGKKNMKMKSSTPIQIMCSISREAIILLDKPIFILVLVAEMRRVAA